MSDSTGWAIRLPASVRPLAGPLRLEPDVDACLAEGVVWLRGPALSDELAMQLRKLAADGIFEVAADGTLTRPETILPAGQLPQTGWQSLSRFLSPVPQPTAPGGQLLDPTALRIERSQVETPASLLLTRVESWAAYAIDAPAVRLAPLKTAACDDGRVVVLGTPLPPIRGTRYVVDQGIAVACGWQIVPAVDSAVLCELLRLRDGDVALFRADGSYERIESASFTRATRGGARLALAELAGE